MKELCQRVTDLKMLIMQSLENDCDKDELNNQIAVSSKMIDVNGREISRFFGSSSHAYFCARREAHNMIACF
jgi:hypothetical protein